MSDQKTARRNRGKSNPIPSPITLQNLPVCHNGDWKGLELADRILRRPEVERLTGLGRSTIYAWMARGEFPRPMKLGVRAVGWRGSDVLAWLATRRPRTAA